MRRYRTIAPYLLPLVCVAALLCVAAQKNESGSDPYTPTKLEWLAMEANVQADESLRSEAYHITAIPKPPNTILLQVSIAPTFEGARGGEELLKMAIGGRAEYVTGMARAKGWLNWLQIKQEVFDMRDLKK